MSGRLDLSQRQPLTHATSCYRCNITSNHVDVHSGIFCSSAVVRFSSWGGIGLHFASCPELIVRVQRGVLAARAESVGLPRAQQCRSCLDAGMGSWPTPPDRLPWHGPDFKSLQYGAPTVGPTVVLGALLGCSASLVVFKMYS